MLVFAVQILQFLGEKEPWSMASEAIGSSRAVASVMTINSINNNSFCSWAQMVALFRTHVDEVNPYTLNYKA